MQQVLSSVLIFGSNLCLCVFVSFVLGQRIIIMINIKYVFVREVFVLSNVFPFKLNSNGFS